MPRKHTNVMPSWRPQIPINWDKVDKLLESGCGATEIAGYLGCCRETIYDRCLEEKGIPFTTYSCQKRSSGDSLLREKQMSVALEGNQSMLIWLGKNRLGQRDDPITESAFNGALAETLELLKKSNVKKQDEPEESCEKIS